MAATACRGQYLFHGAFMSMHHNLTSIETSLQNLTASLGHSHPSICASPELKTHPQSLHLTLDLSSLWKVMLGFQKT